MCGSYFAMKIIQMSGQDLSMIENEVSLMEQCRHINIVNCLTVFQSGNQLQIVMELAKGDLSSQIRWACLFLGRPNGA